MSVTATSDTQVGANAGGSPHGSAPKPEPEYHLTFVDSALPPVSLFRQIWQLLHEPKNTVPKEYYRGKVALPATDLRPWIFDIPNQLKSLFEKPKNNIGSEYYRGEMDLPATDMRPWILDIPNQIRALFEKPKPPSIPITSHPVDVPNMWQDYQPQSGSWMNSLLVHVVGVAIILLPFLISQVNTPAKVSAKSEVIDISPYLAEIEAAGKKAGGRWRRRRPLADTGIEGRSSQVCEDTSCSPNGGNSKSSPHPAGRANLVGPARVETPTDGFQFAQLGRSAGRCRPAFQRAWNGWRHRFR